MCTQTLFYVIILSFPPCTCTESQESPSKRKYSKRHPRFFRFQMVDGEAIVRKPDGSITLPDPLQKCTKADLIQKVKRLTNELNDAKEAISERNQKLKMKDLIIQNSENEMAALTAKMSVGVYFFHVHKLRLLTHYWALL